jgi:hypothetical protein
MIWGADDRIIYSGYPGLSWKRLDLRVLLSGRAVMMDAMVAQSTNLEGAPFFQRTWNFCAKECSWSAPAFGPGKSNLYFRGQRGFTLILVRVRRKSEERGQEKINGGQRRECQWEAYVLAEGYVL